MPVVYVRNDQQFLRLARELRGPANKELRKQLGKALRQRATPVVQDVRAAVRAIPAKGSRGGGTAARTAARRVTKSGKVRKNPRPRGLRDTIAASTAFQLRLSGSSPAVRILVRQSSLPANQRYLPSRLNNPQGWRHPVFGNRDNWVHQQGHPFFDVTIGKHAQPLRRDILAAIDRACTVIASRSSSGGQ